MKLTKRLLSLLAALCLVVGMVSVTGIVAHAAEPAGYVAVSVDANVLGAGYLYEPAMVPFYAGENWAEITVRFLGGGNYQAWGTPKVDFYLTGIKLQKNITINLPESIEDAVDIWLDGELDPGASQAGEFLKANDYFELFNYASGWMVTVNDAFLDYGVSSMETGMVPQDGDVARWQFSLFCASDLGNDWGYPYGFGYNIAEPEDRTDLTIAVAKINSSAAKAEVLAATAVKSAYDTAYVALQDLEATVSEISTALANLNSALAAQLTQAKTDAKAALDSYKTAADYRDAQKTELTAAIAAGKTAIDGATDLAGVNAALAAAKAKMDAIKTDAVLKAGEQAKAALDAYADADDYRDAQKDELADAIAAGKAAIDAAKDAAGVTAALAAAKAAIDVIKTDAQLSADEPFWMHVSPFLQFVLRYVFFGWIWMVPARANWFSYYILFGWVRG